MSRLLQPVIMRNQVTIAALLLSLAAQALAQESASPASDTVSGRQGTQEPARHDLDVTMQIIVDPDAKLPDEVVRRIPLPTRKPNTPPVVKQPSEKGDRPDHGQSEAARQRAQERSQEAAEQRERARRSVVEERRRNPGPPQDPPRRPETPPRN